MRGARWQAALATGTVLAGLLALQPSPASADGSFSLPWSQYGHIVADSQGHVFVTGGPGTDGIWVRNADGSTNSTITNEPGASGMVLSDDGSTLYVGLFDGEAISVIDTTTLTETQRISATGTCPDSVALVASAVWFSTECDGADSPLGEAPLNTGVPAYTTDVFYRALLLAVPGDPSGLLVAQRGISPASVTRYAVSDATLSMVASHDGGADEANLGSMAIDPDGAHLILACGAPYHHVKLLLSDLSNDGTYDSDTYPNSVATSTARGGLVAAGVNGIYWPDVYVYRGGQFMRSINFGDDQLVADGLAWSADGVHLYAVTAPPSSGSLTLHVLDSAALSRSVMTIGTSASAVPRGHSVTVSGSLTAAGAAAAGQPVTIQRRDGSGSKLIGTLTTKADGSWTIRDSPAWAGIATYTASFPGDSDTAPAHASQNVKVIGKAPSLTLKASNSRLDYGGKATVKIHLGKTSGNRNVSIYLARYPSGFQHVRTHRVSGSGNFTYRFPVYGRTSVRATFAGDRLYSPLQKTVTVRAHAKIVEHLRMRHGNPVLIAVMAPIQATCLTFQSQQFSGGHWLHGPASECIMTNTAGAAAAILHGTHAPGDVWRLRAVFAGTTQNLPTPGEWSYITFTNKLASRTTSDPSSLTQLSGRDLRRL